MYKWWRRSNVFMCSCARSMVFYVPLYSIVCRVLFSYFVCELLAGPLSTTSAGMNIHKGERAYIWVIKGYVYVGACLVAFRAPLHTKALPTCGDLTQSSTKVRLVVKCERATICRVAMYHRYIEALPWQIEINLFVPQRRSMKSKDS